MWEMFRQKDNRKLDAVEDGYETRPTSVKKLRRNITFQKEVSIKKTEGQSKYKATYLLNLQKTK